MRRPRLPAAPVLPPQSVAAEWLRRIEAEYRSLAATQHLTLWLVQVGASPDLIRLGLQIAADELLHAELSHQIYRAAGGTALPQLPREELGLMTPRETTLESSLLQHGVELFCLGETAAVPLFSALRRHSTVPEVHRALSRILRDEVRHRDFGWTLLDWLLAGRHGPGLRDELAAKLPAMLERLWDSYAPPALALAPTELSEIEHAWGLMAPARYAEALLRCYQRDLLPRFARLGVSCPPPPLPVSSPP